MLTQWAKRSMPSGLIIGSITITISSRQRRTCSSSEWARVQATIGAAEAPEASLPCTE
jgi:hypothetical protein